MNKINIYITQVLAVVLILSSTSCEKIMEVNPKDSLLANNFYKDQSEVYGAFIGLSGLFSQVAEQTIILSELKGDLMTPTSNAPSEFWDIYRYQSDNSTSYASSKRYYDLVLNVNDFLKRVSKFYQDAPTAIDAHVYKGMVSQAINYKVWAYLTIGKFWGETSVYSSNMEDKYDDALITLTLDQLPRYLIDYLQAGENGIDAFQNFEWAWILDPSSTDKDPDVNWIGICLDARVLMGELYLWGGDYQLAIDQLSAYMVDEKKFGDNYTLTDKKESWAAVKYKDIFEESYTEVMGAIVTAVPFSAAEGQEHNLLTYFSPKSPNLYYFAATNHAVELFNSQVRSNFAKGDNIRGNNISFKLVTNSGGDYYINKYMLTKSEESEYEDYESESDIYVYRTSELNLMLSEALCFLGRFEESLAFLDKGTDTYWGGASFNPPFTYLNSYFQNNRGIRARAGLLELESNSVFEACNSVQDSIRALSGVIADEFALELAYEGKRWPALIRMADNLNETSFLAKKVSRKFENEAVTYEGILSDRNTWFIKDDINETQK